MMLVFPGTWKKQNKSKNYKNGSIQNEHRDFQFIPLKFPQA